jgi:hypothetical protein
LSSISLSPSTLFAFLHLCDFGSRPTHGKASWIKTAHPEKGFGVAVPLHSTPATRNRQGLTLSVGLLGDPPSASSFESCYYPDQRRANLHLLYYVRSHRQARCPPAACSLHILQGSVAVSCLNSDVSSTHFACPATIPQIPKK